MLVARAQIHILAQTHGQAACETIVFEDCMSGIDGHLAKTLFFTLAVFHRIDRIAFPGTNKQMAEHFLISDWEVLISAGLEIKYFEEVVMAQ